jgi:hypothetical protein
VRRGDGLAGDPVAEVLDLAREDTDLAAVDRGRLA